MFMSGRSTLTRASVIGTTLHHKIPLCKSERPGECTNLPAETHARVNALRRALSRPLFVRSFARSFICSFVRSCSTRRQLESEKATRADESGLSLLIPSI